MFINQKANFVAYENARPEFTKKIYPPYGRKLEAIRRSGLIPDNRVIVSTDWKIGKVYPRIVIPRELSVHRLRFDYLAGLSVQIVYFESHQFVVPDLINEILKVNPLILATFNLSAVKDGKPAFKLICSELVEALNV